VDVVLIVAISLDGCITKHSSAGTAWTSEADQVHFRRELSTVDAHVFGSGTYLTERPRIRAALSTGKRRVVMTRTPDEYAADAVAGALEFTDGSPASIVEGLRADGFTRLAVLGGSVVYSAFLAAELCDQVLVTVEPRVFGSGTRFAGIETALDTTLCLNAVEHLNDDTLLLRYSRQKELGAN
jgi:dihydrofolate reductase